MPRPLLPRSGFFPYHVTARVNNRAPFPIPIERVWEVICSELLIQSSLRTFEVQALTLMPNHFHLLATTPEQNLGQIMLPFMSNVTRTINRISGQSGHLFGGPYYRSLIDTPEYYANAVRYVYQNPLRAGLVDRTEVYPWSTLYTRVGRAWQPFPLYYPRCGFGISSVPERMDELLDWVNRPTPQETLDEIRGKLKAAPVEASDADQSRGVYLTIG